MSLAKKGGCRIVEQNGNKIQLLTVPITYINLYDTVKVVLGFVYTTLGHILCSTGLFVYFGWCDTKSLTSHRKKLHFLEVNSYTELF